MVLIVLIRFFLSVGSWSEFTQINKHFFLHPFLLSAVFFHHAGEIGDHYLYTVIIKTGSHYTHTFDIV